jgi:hypothetical protein
MADFTLACAVASSVIVVFSFASGFVTVAALLADRGAGGLVDRADDVDWADRLSGHSEFECRLGHGRVRRRRGFSDVDGRRGPGIDRHGLASGQGDGSGEQ